MKEHTKNFMWCVFQIINCIFGIYAWSVLGLPHILFMAGLMLGLSAMFLTEGLHDLSNYYRDKINELQTKRSTGVR